MPDVYNSAYTGTQIDAAIGAVRNKEEVWDAKQSKLTGSPGQVVGFDDEGDAIATPAPSGLPDGATEGQMLYQGATGPEWGDKPVMYVNVTMTSGTEGTADKTAAEIADAVNKGYAVFAAPTFSGVSLGNLMLTGAETGQAVFSAASLSGSVSIPSARMSAIVVDASGSAVVVGATISTLDSTGKVPASQLPDMDYVPTSRTVNGKALSADITLAASDVGARPDTWTPSAADVGAVPTSRTVNGKALSSDITLSAGDVGARPDTWMPDANDVGARPDTWTPTAQEIGALPTAGGTLTGALTLSGAPTNANHAATKAYVDGKAALVFTNISVTTSMTWGTHSVTKVNDNGFTQRVTVPISGVTVNHIPLSVNLDVTSRYNGNWSDYCDTYNGGLYLYAKEAMAATIESATFVDSQS